MIRLFVILLLVVLAGAGTLYLASLPGSVQINAFGIVAEINLVWATLLALLLCGVVIGIWSLLSGLWTLPGKVGRSRQQARIRKANQALADGLLAAEAGDAAQAIRHARKAAKYAEDERLKLLLEARAAEAGNDWSGAERAWGQLTRLPGGQLAGLRGAATAAIERGDMSSAEARAREALALKSGADWPFNSLFDLQVSRGEWAEALDTLSLGERRGLIEGDSLRRRRAVLHAAFATGLPNHRRQEAQKALAEAIRSAPAFPPAAWHGARHLIIDGKVKAAQGVLELGWKARPHPALAQLARRASKVDTVEARRKRLEALIAVHPEHRESRILAAELAMEAKDWVTAVRTLAELIEAGPTARLCLLMERALKGYGDIKEAGRWARMAVSASREADWSDIDPKGGAFDYMKADWSRLVYKFGDVGELVHPRYESFGRELEAGRAMALPAPVEEEAEARAIAPTGPTAPPLDYVSEED